MKKALAAVLLSALVLSPDASADCVPDSFGKEACGEGQCEADKTGKVFCAALGGGAVRDNYGQVKCGRGYCERDSQGEVWCSKEPRRSPALDADGKVKCADGCDAGSASLCQEGKHK